MDILNKELDITVKVLSPSIYIKGKCTASKEYDMSKTFYVKKNTLRQNGHEAQNLSRLHGTTGYGPVVVSFLLHMSLSSNKHVVRECRMSLNNVTVNKINGRKMEDYFGINLEKWPLDMLHLRFLCELGYAQAYADNPGGEILMGPAENSKDFVKQLMFARMTKTKLENKYPTSAATNGRTELYKICDIF